MTDYILDESNLSIRPVNHDPIFNSFQSADVASDPNDRDVIDAFLARHNLDTTGSPPARTARAVAHLIKLLGFTA